MKALALNANKRTVEGRKVKNLRRDGLLPATIYGNGLTPISVQVKTDEFAHAYKQTGETGLISLTVDGESHPVLVSTVQLDPVSSLPIHVEFHQVNLKEKIKANVPLVVVGESSAVKEKTGTLLQLLSEVEVEALPTDLPENIEVDISKLANVNDHLLVKELVMPAEVTLVTDPEIMIIKIGELVAPEPEPVAAPAEGEAAPVVGEEAAEGEAKGTEEKKETKEAPSKPESPKKE